MAADQAASRDVIRSRVRPPAGAGRVPRERPEALLAEAVESRRVVVLSATAGAGKTTLAAAVAARGERPVAWLTLDWTDTAAARLVTYLEAALAVAVPRVAGVARAALAARVPHPEAVGLLVEAVAGRHVLLVVDELDRLAEDAPAWAVIEALLRYAPPDMRVVLCSRRPVPAAALPSGADEVLQLGDDVLSLTVEEAAALLAASGRPSVDPAAAVRANGGWLTGVLLEAGEDRRGALSDYLSAHVLNGLPAADRRFLVATSVLDEVTSARAGALGMADAGVRLAALRRVHLPATWRDDRALRCHPRFREHLLDELDGWEAERSRAVHAAHGRLLAAEGRHEDATEALLLAGASAEAVAPAATAILGLVDRLELARAQRWLDALAGVEPEGMSPFVMARLRLAVATEQYGLGLELADRLAASGALDAVASGSSAAAVLLAHCYAMAGRHDDMLAIAARAPRDADHQTLRGLVALHATGPAPGRLPGPTGGPLDGLALRVIWCHGRLGRALETTGAWTDALARPWLIAALADAGQLPEAVALLEPARSAGLAATSLEAVVAPRVLTDAGRREEALEAVARGRRLARAGASVVDELAAGLEEARLRLRLDRDAPAALAALDPVDRHPLTHRSPHLGPAVDGWYGLALLLAGRDAEALDRLRRSVASQRSTRMVLHLPAAAVYLAEAEWRTGDEDAADAAADVALEAARLQGFDHMLLLALRDFPAVLSRRLDAEPAGDSPWHALARALHAQDLHVEVSSRPSVQLVEFGRLAIEIEGEEVRPGIAKIHELLAYLLTRPRRRADRAELLDALFDARADDPTRSYLRQVVHRLRLVLPADGLVSDRTSVGLSDGLAVMSESVELERALAQAARLRGGYRLAATLEALRAADQGAYLPGIESQWVQQRRQDLRELITDARYEAARLALAESRLETAEELTETVLADEPFHEPSWRLAMRLAGARGDDHAVLRAYQRCRRVLAEVGAEPSRTTRELVDRLRR